MRLNKKQKGFSLIELMIVVAVIGVLTSIAVPQYQTYVQKSELGSGLATITALKVHVEDRIATLGAFPTVATTDMQTKLGASVTTLGNLSTQQHASDKQAGLIKIQFATTTQVGNDILALQRSASGTWTCITDSQKPASIFPKGCTSGTIY